MLRTVEAEYLDSLPADDPAAVHSRRDLRWINAVMGNHRWFCRRLQDWVRPGERVLELGAGGGELMIRLRANGIEISGLDLQPNPFGAVERTSNAWHQSDLLEFDGWANYPVVIANLILHHFEREQLRKLGNYIRSNCRLIVASEPARGRRFQLLFALFCRGIGAHAVTRHDGHVSIAAGFRGDELPELLGLERELWSWQIQTSLGGAYRMVAHRLDSKTPNT